VAPHPELAEHVDYLAVHMLPYWEGMPVDTAVDYIDDKMRWLQRTFPGKPIVIAEVGWPSTGRTREAVAVSERANQALFLRRFLATPAGEAYVYYVMEAFDQPWKARPKAPWAPTGACTTSTAGQVRVHRADRPHAGMAAPSPASRSGWRRCCWRVLS
jgi:exo-beta-1,3-glucanase (GH17 family)